MSLYDITYIIMYNNAAIHVSRLLQLAEAAGAYVVDCFEGVSIIHCGLMHNVEYTLIDTSCML